MPATCVSSIYTALSRLDRAKIDKISNPSSNPGIGTFYLITFEPLRQIHPDKEQNTSRSNIHPNNKAEQDLVVHLEALLTNMYDF
jgi:hypothetical protein